MTVTYCRFGGVYLLGVVLCWLLGVEAIRGHVMPFYALWKPLFTSIVVPAAAVTTVLLLWVVYARTRLRYRWKQLRVQLLLSSALVVVILVVARNELTHSGLPAAETLRNYREGFVWHLPTILVLCMSVPLFHAVSRSIWDDPESSSWSTLRVLTGLLLFGFMFAGAIAMIRGGPPGIVEPFLRYRLEYISDIGQGGSIRGLFANFLELRPGLSLHGRIHPPGAIALLWLIAAVVGRDPWPLSLATMAMGASSVFPLYYWAKNVAGHRVALAACCLFVVMPSIVLFTATSFDIAFMPFTLMTLFAFWRAVTRPSAPWALAAGAGYALLTLLSFTLATVGCFFGLVAVWRFFNPIHRRAVIQAGIMMVLAFAATHIAVHLWSGFDVIACFRVCYAQFRLDQMMVDMTEPRYTGWVWKLLNPASWMFFAGIPVSVLLFRRLRRPEAATRGLFWSFGLTLLALTLLYPGRGEGERSAMYVLPFAVIPAAHMLDSLATPSRSTKPLAVTWAFMAAQCWLVELCFYTYW